MIRIACICVAVLMSTVSQAEQVTLELQGTVTSVRDANAAGGPEIDFEPIPVGSPFSSAITYDSDSPTTRSQTGSTTYLDLLSSAGLFTVNGYEFASTAGVSASVVSEEANFGFSGVQFPTQPISLPSGWSVDGPSDPYLTVRLLDDAPETRSLALPSTADEIPTDNMLFVLDFLQPLTVDGEVYGDRVYVSGQIDVLRVTVGDLPPQEVSIQIDTGRGNGKIVLHSAKPKPIDVVVFGDASFDVLSIKSDSIGLGDPMLTDPVAGPGQKAPPESIAYGDVDGDGELDLLLSFDLATLQDLGAIDAQSTSLEFVAVKETGGAVFGSHEVAIAGSKGAGKSGK